MHFKRLSLLLGLVALCLPSTAVAAAAFARCPSYAFIVQSPGSTPILYGVDLSIGSYATLEGDMGTSKINGAGFNYHDKFIYAWDYGAGTLARIGTDYQAEPLDLSGLIGKPFYVGDVSVLENAWFGYRPGYGLYRVDLANPGAPLVLQQISGSTAMGNPRITDMAFHPSDGLIYAVDNDGYLLSIDPASGATVVLTRVLDEAELGFNFTFGAQFFDVDGNLYISNNGNGYVYRVALAGAASSAVFFTYGPSSSSNDGARCALAQIEVGDAVDFGDAPDSYATSLANAGARHGIGGVYLGSRIDGETDAYAHPLSDDLSDASDDDDGIAFPVGFETGETAFVIASVTGAGGYLNAWIDWDGDGSFENDEQVAAGLPVSEGANNVFFDVPAWAMAGDSWARFRVGTLADIGPAGGVGNGEVEDYPVTITERGVTATHYPSGGGYTSFAFEDLYPELGDFDMNDVLMNLRITEYRRGGQVIRLKLEGRLAALGASYHNGFAIRLPGIAADAVKGDSIQLTVNDRRARGAVLEDGRDNPVLVVSNDLWDMVQAGEADCYYFRTEAGCGTSSRPSWRMIVPFLTPVPDAGMPPMPYDPFIFAAPGTYHGDLLTLVIGNHPGRKFEVHLKNRAPTGAFDRRILGLADDASDETLERWFQSGDGIPWALEIPVDWRHPREGVSLLEAYPQFAGFAADATGQTNPQWYLQENAAPAYLFED